MRVAVLGGGMGALAAAWQLVTLDPRRYDVTVYQRGWRLGGKGASGRNREPGKGLRIEEHGLHILMGFYDHVFHMLKTCYDDLGPGPGDGAHGGIGPWEEALTGSDHIHVCDRYRDGHSEIWELRLPTNSSEVPGTRAPEDPDIAQWIRNGLAFIYQLIRDTDPDSLDRVNGGEPPRPSGSRWFDWLARTLVQRERDPQRQRSDLLSNATKTSIRWALLLLFRRLGDPERRDPITIARRRQVITAYFVGANLLGIINEALWSKQDFLRAAQRLDHLDYREWLHGNTGRIGEDWPELAWDSPLVQAVYDLIFSRGSGFGAGTALYDTLCMLLNYRGQVYYRMNGGMGDVVFSPLYLWLRRQGVKFRFFHRVRKLEVEEIGGKREVPRTKLIRQITLEQQVDLGREDYDPLFEVCGRPCWPSKPLLERLSASERRRVERSDYDFETSPEAFGQLTQLRRGRDFDVAVLGIPVGVFAEEGELIEELAAAHTPFADMVRGIQTVRTRALQIWTDQDSMTMGWRGQPGMLGAYEHPFASWADMSQVLPQEPWEHPGGVRGVHYFCGVYEGADRQSGEIVQRDAVQWMESFLPGLLPSWNWERLCSVAGEGEQRLAAQYWRANTSPSDRYVLAAPGTLRFRLAPDESGFENLYLAGDWVKTDLNAGCVEAAAMAGMAAARAIHGRRGEMVPVHCPAPAVERSSPAPQPAYVDRDSDWVLRAPVQAEDVTTAAFLLRADPEALIAMCADQVDRPTAGAVTALPWPARAGLVVLLCSDLPRVGSADEEHGQFGNFHERDVGFFVPVDFRTRGGRHDIGLLPPYLFVDSAIGLMAGREIYGFSKLLAHIDMPTPVPGRGFELPLSVTVTADVLSAWPTGRAGERATRQVEQATVLQVNPSCTASLTPGAAPAQSPGRALVPRPGLWRFLPDLLGRSLVRSDWSLMGAIRRGASVGIPMVFLKQFRDARSPSQACHQSLVLCRARAALLGAPRRLPGSFVIRLPQHFKPDLAGMLGLPNEVETHLAMQLRHNLFLPQGTQLWP